MDVGIPYATSAEIPVTPRKAHRVPSQASWTPAQQIKETHTPLENYALGDCLGRGASAFVYKALNLSTGSTVAIKRIKVENPSAGGIDAIMMEIDLLKNLNHPNIVKYHGFIKAGNTLNIILEYCENGSLTSICRKFGKFPETLVAVYIAQVLQGLVYLHDQGTIHRDIKGANILTTKDGNAKLADFGVATRINKFVTSNNTVVGSPYWMAPEVIELNGATAAADIWSVGCTVVELLTGNPPFYKMDPIPAMFAIVHDDQPSLPKGITAQLQDFLMQCFRKDPLIRPTAKTLLKHPWIIQNKSRSTVRLGEAGTQPQPLYDETVKTVQEWNSKKASHSSASTNQSMKQKSSKLHLRQRKQLAPNDLNRYKEDNGQFPTLSSINTFY
jgi:serine/threonine protein kinase